MDSFPAALLASLVSAGLLRPTPPRRLGTGNRDRDPAQTRSSWRAVHADGRLLKLVVARDLSPVAQRQSEFARACSALVPALVFDHSAEGWHCLAEEFLFGPNLEDAAAHLPADAVQRSFAQACAALAATTQPSSEVARAAEWSARVDEWCALDLWSDAERGSLRDLVLPALYARLAATLPETRWTNGDFLPTNLRYDAAGRLRLIDAEFALRTHFFAEDAVRFHVLSPAARALPQLFRAALPPRGVAWHLFFWLRQLHLESTHNTAA